MKGLQFTVEEKQLLIESLLFTSVTDICSEHTAVQRKHMIELAQRLNTPELKLHNIYVYALEESVRDDVETDSVIKNFPNLTVQTTITD
jgi:hypothetical protein